MLVEVTTSSTDAQLTTTEAVKNVLRTTLTSDDALLDSLITRASQWAETFVGYPLSAQQYRETLPGYGSRRLVVGRTPVVAVTGFWTATDTGTATTMLSSEYRLDREAGMLDRSVGWAWDVPPVPQDFAVPLAPTPWAGQEDPLWLVDYVAGYTRTGLSTGSAVWSTAKGTTSTGRTLPESIEQAIIHKVVQWYEGHENVIEKRVGDLSVQYDPVGEDPAEVLLSPYRRSA